MSEREDFLWQRFFAACACSLSSSRSSASRSPGRSRRLSHGALSRPRRITWNTRPDFWSGGGAVQHRDGIPSHLDSAVLPHAEPPGRRSRAVTAVTVASLAASPVLLSFDLAVFGVVAYRPDRISPPDITRALSDLAWLGSQHIWPMLTVGMALAGILILRTQAGPSRSPAWLGYFSLVVALCEFGQLPIFFFKSGPLSGDGAAAWYLATFTWGGPWILAAGWSMYQILGRLQTNRSAESRHSVLQ